MSRGSTSHTEETSEKINLAEDYPGIYFHLQDKRAACIALMSASAAQSQLLLEQYRRESALSRGKLQKTIEISDHIQFNILESHDLFDKPVITITTLLQAKKRSRYFRGMRINGDALKLLLPMDLSGVDFGNCVFECDVDFTRCNLKNANFQGAVFNKKLIVNDADLRGANFKDAAVTELCTNIKTKCSGRFTSSLIQKNKVTKINRETYCLDEKLAITVYTNGSEYKIFIADIEYDPRQFWNNFEIEYRKLQKKGGFGDQIKHLKKLSLIQKISALFLHAQEDNKSRTLTALKIIVQRAASVIVPSVQQPPLCDSRETEPQHVPRESSKVDLIEPVTTQTMASPFGGVIADEEILRRLTVDFYNRESGQLLDSIEADAASIMLRNALHSITTLTENIANLLKKYQYLKAKNDDTRFVDQLLLEQIFPEFLKQIIYRQASKIIPYKLLNDFFKESGLPSHVKEIMSNAQFVFSGEVRLITVNKALFLKTCHIAWGELSLSTLVDINVAAKETAACVFEKMKAHSQLREPERTCVERQYYLARLIQTEKYSEAEKEAEALRAAWPTYPFEDDQYGIFSTMSDTIKKGLIKSVEEKLSASVSAEDEKNVKDYFYQQCQPGRIQEVFKKLMMPVGFYELRTKLRAAHEKLFYFTNPMTDAIDVTVLMRRIAKNVLLYKQPIDQDDVKLLYRCVNRPFVWIAGETERQALFQAADQNVCLPEMIRRMLGNAMMADDLLKNNAREIMDASLIKEQDFKDFVNGLLDIPAITDDLKKIFRSIWLEYEPIKRAVRELPNGDLLFADPDVSETRALVAHPEINMMKLRQAKTLYELFKDIELAILNPSYNFSGVRQISVSCDVFLARESYQKEKFPVPALLPIREISCEIGHLRKQLDDFLLELGDESTKTFGKKINLASEAVRARKKTWEKHVTALIQLQDRVPEQRSAMAL
ncbi:MAG: pentapeptide repeat-containing protein [Coxiellaceae bacterium]|nr:pentapeptide repeat-containing protein [Coxiellaceae bacterium]